MIIERDYIARVEELWQLWTTKEGFESWWGPEGFRAEVHTLEARPGGLLSYEMFATDPQQIAVMQQMGRPSAHGVQARFTEVVPQQRLAITSVIDFVPGVQPYESRIAVSFVPSGRSVRMTVALDPMHSEEWTRLATLGFTSQLNKLDRRFTVAP
jgi:uncharacterized protein YndB with AHSA1/START domain